MRWLEYHILGKFFLLISYHCIEISRVIVGSKGYSTYYDRKPVCILTLNSACCSMCLSKEGLETEVKSHFEH